MPFCLMQILLWNHNSAVCTVKQEKDASALKKETPEMIYADFSNGEQNLLELHKVMYINMFIYL